MTDRSRSRNRLILLKSREFYEWDVKTLIEWMSDPDSEVRDWATTALAASGDASPIVRDALLARVADADFDVRSEAILGLARRRDQRVLPFLKEALQAERVGQLYVEAAGYASDQQLVEPLELLRSWWDIDASLLEEVIERCRGRTFHSRRNWEYID